MKVDTLSMDETHAVAINTLADRVSQCEVDIKALAEAVGKFTEAVDRLQKTQLEAIAVFSQFLPKRRES